MIRGLIKQKELPEEEPQTLSLLLELREQRHEAGVFRNWKAEGKALCRGSDVEEGALPGRHSGLHGPDEAGCGRVIRSPNAMVR